MSAEDVDLALQLYARIKARYLGEAVASMSGAGRSASFSEMPIEKLVQFYRQVRNRLSAEELSLNDLPVVEMPDAPISTGARVAGAFASRHFV